MPGDLARLRVQRQGGVVVEVPEIPAPEQELGRRRSHRGADVDELQHRVVARHHPGADVRAILERDVTPGFVARLTRRRNRAAPPEFGPGLGVVGDDDAGVGTAAGQATAARDHLAVGDDRAGALHRRLRLVVEDHRLPDQLARRRVEGEGELVDARVDDQTVVDRDVAVVGRERPDLPEDVVR